MRGGRKGVTCGKYEAERRGFSPFFVHAKVMDTAGVRDKIVNK